MSFHVFFAGNIGSVVNNYFSNASAASNTWDFSNANDYNLSDNVSLSVQQGIADLNLQLTQTGSIANNGTSVFLDRAWRMHVVGDYAYVSAQTQDRIQVLDISDPTSPIAVTSLENNNTTLMLNGPNDIVSKGNYLYVAEQVGDAIQILDITNPAAPVAAGNYANDANVFLNGPRGLAIQGDYLYVAVANDDALQIFDISVPTTLTPVGNLDTANGRLNFARGIIVEGDYAYMSARNDDSVQIIDISDPTTPIFVAEVEDDGTSIFLDAVYGIAKSGDYIYATGYNQDRIQIIDVSDPLAPFPVGSLDDTDLPGLNGPRDVAVDGDFLFINNYLGDDVIVVDISDPGNPIFESDLNNSDPNTNLNGPRDIQVVGDLVYIASFSDDDFVILEKFYDSSSPSITPTTSFNYGTEDLATFTEVLGAGNQGTASYQISRDGGTSWYYHDGTTWQGTTGGVNESSSAAIINSNISDFNNVGSGNDFLWRAYLNSNGNQKVEIDSITITSVAVNPILSVTKTDNDADNIVQTNQLIRYTIEVVNNGLDATGVTITDPIDTNFGAPFNFVYNSCGTPTTSFSDPTLTISSVSINSLETCSISYYLQVDTNVADGTIVNNTADSSAASEGGNNPAPATAENLTILACNISDTNIIFETDDFGEDTFWSLTPTGNACGVGEVANGGNPGLDCSSGGTPATAGTGDPYADSVIITEGIFNLTVGQQYDLHVIDDFGDGITVGGSAADPDIRIEQNGVESDTFSVLDDGGVFTFTAVAQTGCEDVMSPHVTIDQAPSQSDPALTDNATFRVMFDEPINVASFTAGDINIAGTTGTITSGPNEIAPNNGTTFEFTVTGMTINDTVMATIPVGGVEDLAGLTNNPSTSTDNSITYEGGDTVAPTITSTNFLSDTLLPGGTHDININYSDDDSGIDTSSISMTLHKFDPIASDFGVNIAASGLTTNSIGIGSSSYSTNSLEYGKYEYKFSVSDLDGNTENLNLVFYIDEPEFIISTPEVDLGVLDINTSTFSDTVTITVRTVGAAFDVFLNSSSNSLNYNIDSIESFDGTTGFGFRQSPYTNNITAISVNENIASEISDINTNGEKNTFTYEIQAAALIDMQQAAGDYTGDLDFSISLTY